MELFTQILGGAGAASGTGSSIAGASAASAATKAATPMAQPSGFNFQGLMKTGQLKNLSPLFQEGGGLEGMGDMALTPPRVNPQDQLARRKQQFPDFLSGLMGP